nr:unnamed protein product [Digitaria exilis]
MVSNPLALPASVCLFSMASPRSSTSSDDDVVPPAAHSTVVQTVNIRSHVPWRYLFDSALGKFGLLRHVSSPTPMADRDAEWLLIDHSVVNWIYTTTSKAVFDMVYQPRTTAFSVWSDIEGIFLDNELQRAVYLEAEFRTLHQGDMSMTDYTAQLKRLADNLRDVGHPVSEPSQVLNLLPRHQVQVAASHVHTARSYLLIEELTADNDDKVDAGQALYAGHRSNTSSGSTDSGGKKPRNKKKSKGGGNAATGGSGGVGGSSGSGGSGGSGVQPSAGLPWAAGYNPWTVLVQAWPMSFRAPGAGVLGSRPGAPAQQAMTAQHLLPLPGPSTSSSSPWDTTALMAALQNSNTAATPPSSSEWFMDTGATSHMSNAPGTFPHLTRSMFNSSITVGNGARLPVSHMAAASIPTHSTPLHLNNVLISPSLVKNLISVRKLTCDNNVSIEFDPRGFSVKDLPTSQVMLRCESSGDLYPLQLMFGQHLSSSDVLPTIRSFHAYLSTQFRLPLLALQTDNGKEFESHAMRTFLSTHGIAFRLSSTYLMNRRPCTATSNITPFQLLLGTVLDYSSLRVFGSLCYPNLTATTAHKLCPRSTACVFIGYPDDHRGYRCYDLATKRVITSRHVVFDESQFPFRRPLDRLPSTVPSPAAIIDDTPPVRLQHLVAPAPARVPSTPLASATTPATRSSPGDTASATAHIPSDAFHATCGRYRGHAADYDASTALTASTSHDHPCEGGHSTPTSQVCGARSHDHVYVAVHVIGRVHVAVLVHVDDLSTTKAAMQAEFDALQHNSTWTLVDRPPGAQTITGKWVFKHKLRSDGTLERYKARWVVRGFNQRPGVDFGETFTPVVKLATIRSVLAVVANKRWSAHQLDVSNAFLHGHLHEKVYCQQPIGFVDPDRPNAVCQLSRSLYGLRQAPRVWFTRFTDYVKSIGFTQTRSDSSLFVLRGVGGVVAYLLLYVDDMVLAASSTALLQQLVSKLKEAFAVKDMGPLAYFLGIDVQRSDDGFFLSQAQYVDDLLERAGMSTCKPVATPADTKPKPSTSDGQPVSAADASYYRSMAGALQYLTMTRPDIAYAVQQLCLHIHAPHDVHATMLKRVLRYIKGTPSVGVHLRATSSSSLTAYSDADWAGCPDTRRSTSGFCVFLGDSLVSWSSKRQPTVSRSSAEAEYRGVANAVAECSWLRSLLGELGCPVGSATIVFCDNVSAVYMSRNPVHHKRTKHIELDIHFVREKVALGEVRVLHVPSSGQFADVFTKGLPTALFIDFSNNWGGVKHSSHKHNGHRQTDAADFSPRAATDSLASHTRDPCTPWTRSSCAPAMLTTPPMAPLKPRRSEARLTRHQIGGFRSEVRQLRRSPPMELAIAARLEEVTILDRFNVKLHQLTLNSFVQLSKFFWGVKTFGGEIDLDTFGRFNELHLQKRSVFLEEGGEEHVGQFGVTTFTSRRRSAALKITKVDFTYAQRNRWDVNWPKSWFYVKVGFASSDSNDINYPFAGPLGNVEVSTVIDFDKKSEAFKKNSRCFIHATRRLTGRDVVEEFLAAEIWPLGNDWKPFRVEERQIPGFDLPTTFVIFGLTKPADMSEDDLISKVEWAAKALIGPLTEKEKKAMIDLFEKPSRLNRPWLEMGVKYGDRVKPSKPQKRMKPTKTKLLEAQKRKTACVQQSTSAPNKKPRLTRKVDLSLLDSPEAEAEAEKEKETIEAACGLLGIAGIVGDDLGTSGFMKELAGTSAASGEEPAVEGVNVEEDKVAEAEHKEEDEDAEAEEEKEEKSDEEENDAPDSPSEDDGANSSQEEGEI